MFLDSRGGKLDSISNGRVAKVSCGTARVLEEIVAVTLGKNNLPHCHQRNEM